MLLRFSQRYFSLIVLVLCLFLPALLISCTVDERPLPDVSLKDRASTPTTGALLDIKAFQAQPKSITAGETATLSWNVTGASSLFIEPAIGPVTAAAGNVSIAPKETTLYTLKVSDGRFETSAKFLVIVKKADGSIIWSNSSDDNITAQLPYEGWVYYPSEFVDWKITDRYQDPHPSTGNCWQLGYITNKHSGWMMTDLTIQNRLVLDGLLPGEQRGYTTSIDCNQTPQLKWKWKVYR